MDLLKKENMTRRRFVKNVAGAAFCCTFLPFGALAASEKNSVHKIDDGEAKVHLAAACGTYCGACPAYINKHGEGEENFPSEPVNDNIDNLPIPKQTYPNPRH